MSLELLLPSCSLVLCDKFALRHKHKKQLFSTTALLLTPRCSDSESIVLLSIFVNRKLSQIIGHHLAVVQVFVLLIFMCYSYLIPAFILFLYSFYSLLLFLFFLKIFFYLFIFRESVRWRERERNINVWLPLVCPALGTWPAAQACVLTRNRTSNPLVHRPALNPLSYTSQGHKDLIDIK